jgi:hypothetical protein
LIDGASLSLTAGLLHQLLRYNWLRFGCGERILMKEYSGPLSPDKTAMEFFSHCQRFFFFTFFQSIRRLICDKYRRQSYTVIIQQKPQLGNGEIAIMIYLSQPLAQ